MVRIRLLPLLGLAILLPLPSYADDGETTRLARGEEILRLEPVEGSSLKKGIVRQVIDAPKENVWGVITDYEHYAEFMLRTTEVKILKRDAKHVLYHSKVNMPWPIANVAYDCLVKLAPGGNEIEFEMVPGTGQGVKSFRGTWRLEPFESSKDRTLATYTLFFEPDRWYPRWAFNLGTKQSLSKVIRAVADRVKVGTP